jgi:hypothetical protein
MKEILIILNKLTPTNFFILREQVNELAIRSSETCTVLADMIINKIAVEVKY